MSVRGKKTFRYQGLLFWAQDGMIVVEDSRKAGDVRCVSVSDFRDRARAIGDEANEDNRLNGYSDEIAAKHSVANAMMDIAKEAEAQGDATKTHVHEYFARHGTHRRQLFNGAAFNPPMGTERTKSGIILGKR